MSLFNEIKNQIETNDEKQDNIPWTFENLQNKEPKDKDIKKFINNKKLIKYGMIILIAGILCIALFNFINIKSNINVEKVNTDNNNQESEEIQVHVTGEVNKPGLYKINKDSRLWDAIMAAGGFSANADQNSINLAKTVEDGEQIIINSKEPAQVTQNNTETTTNGKININTADSTALQTLSGVGPSTAQKIIDYRTQNGKFKSIDDLKKISGIGEKTFEKFKDKICV